LPLKRSTTFYKKSKDGKIAIHFDNINKDEIIAYVTQNDKFKKKFNLISDLILSRIRNTQLYDKEDINDNCKDVTAMKFFKQGANGRIYCKEVKSGDGILVVIAAIVHEKKKSQKNSAKEISMINKVGGYEYEL
jgi:hypothetical protein